MHIRRLLAWILSAALAVSLLAGCGREDVLKLLLGLLEGQYVNITVEADAGLEQTLRQAAGENASEEGIDAALQEILGTTVQFEDLEDGQSGEHSFDLVFQSGKDAESAARQTFLKWDKVFSSLPSGGQYHADLAMLEADNGYYILVEVTVKKAGSHGSSDSGSSSGDENDGDDDDTDTGRGYKAVTDGYLVYADEGLENLFADFPGDDFEGDKITLQKLENGKHYTVEKPLAAYPHASFAGTLVSETETVTIELTNGAYLFDQILSGGKVEDIDIEVKSNIGKTTGNVGVVACENLGSVTDCHITLNGYKVEGNTVGGVIGSNVGTVLGCSVEDGTIESSASDANVGGIAGKNSGQGSVKGCYSTSTVTGTNKNSFVGGVVGMNIRGSVEGCYHTGQVSASGADSLAGGAVGKNGHDGDIPGTIYSCYWNDTPNEGIGNWNENQNGSYKEAYKTNGSNKVDDEGDWSAAVIAMSERSGCTFSGNMTRPQLS